MNTKILLDHLDRKIRKAITDYGLIEDGDKILVAVSGGKDSLALLELLSRRVRILKPRFEIVATHIVMSNIPYSTDIDYLCEMADKCNVPFIVRETSFDLTTDKRKSPCFLCSWNRRKALFDIAKEEGCNKIALGHHKDDMLHTLLMNLIHQGSFSTMPPLLKMNKFDMQIIRPLCLIEEKEIATLAQLREYKKQLKNCPYEKESDRTTVKEVLEKMEEIDPKAKNSLWAAMHNIQQDYLPNKNISKQ